MGQARPPSAQAVCTDGWRVCEQTHAQPVPRQWHVVAWTGGAGLGFGAKSRLFILIDFLIQWMVLRCGSTASSYRQQCTRRYNLEDQIDVFRRGDLFCCFRSIDRSWIDHQINLTPREEPWYLLPSFPSPPSSWLLPLPEIVPSLAMHRLLD